MVLSEPYLLLFWFVRVVLMIKDTGCEIMNFNLQRLLLRALMVVFPMSMCSALWWHENDELESLILRGLQENPRLQRFWREVEQAGYEQTALEGFWDPRLYSRSGHAGGFDGDDRVWLDAGAEMAFPWGGYLNFSLGGGSVRPSANTNADSLYETTASIDGRWPLWRDRGFREWRLRDKLAGAEYDAAHARWVAAAQALRRDISLAYIAVLQRRALLQVALSSKDRAEKLLEEAETLAALDAIPEYQVSAARLEAILRHEEVVSVRETIESEQWRLQELLGTQADVPLDINADPDDLLRWARQAPAIDEVPGYGETGVAQRGDRRENIALQQAAQGFYELAEERRRSDLSLELNVSHHAEDPDRWPATEARRRERATGWEAALVWSRPWGSVAEHAEAARQGARLKGLKERERELDQENRVRMEIAGGKYRAAVERLRMISEAVTAAEVALQAESERFRLGENRSRDVLDAQKDLTDTMQRQNLMAAELLRAAVAFHYSLGFAPAVGNDGENTP